MAQVYINSGNGIACCEYINYDMNIEHWTLNIDDYEPQKEKGCWYGSYELFVSH